MERVRSWWRDWYNGWRVTYMFFAHPEVLERLVSIERIRVLRRTQERMNGHP